MVRTIVKNGSSISQNGTTILPNCYVPVDPNGSAIFYFASAIFREAMWRSGKWEAGRGFNGSAVQWFNSSAVQEFNGSVEKGKAGKWEEGKRHLILPLGEGGSAIKLRPIPVPLLERDEGRGYIEFLNLIALEKGVGGIDNQFSGSGVQWFSGKGGSGSMV